MQRLHTSKEKLENDAKTNVSPSLDVKISQGPASVLESSHISFSNNASDRFDSLMNPELPSELNAAISRTTTNHHEPSCQSGIKRGAYEDHFTVRPVKKRQNHENKQDDCDNNLEPRLIGDLSAVDDEW